MNFLGGAGFYSPPWQLLSQTRLPYLVITIFFTGSPPLATRKATRECSWTFASVSRNHANISLYGHVSPEEHFCSLLKLSKSLRYWKSSKMSLPRLLVRALCLQNNSRERSEKWKHCLLQKRSLFGHRKNKLTKTWVFSTLHVMMSYRAFLWKYSYL